MNSTKVDAWINSGIFLIYCTQQIYIRGLEGIDILFAALLLFCPSSILASSGSLYFIQLICQLLCIKEHTKWINANVIVSRSPSALTSLRSSRSSRWKLLRQTPGSSSICTSTWCPVWHSRCLIRPSRARRPFSPPDTTREDLILHPNHTPPSSKSSRYMSGVLLGFNKHSVTKVWSFYFD